LTGLLPNAPGGVTPTKIWICFGIGVAATVLYLLARFRREQMTMGISFKVMQIVIATLAFVLWAWVLQDPRTAVVNPFWGRFSLPIFTFVVGLYEP